jgi:site-specific recombinase XerD
MAKQYAITRDKFFSIEQATDLLQVCERMAEADLSCGRRTWVTRSMLIGLALRTGLRIFEIANLKIGDIHTGVSESYLTVQRGKGNKKRDVYFNGSLSGPLEKYLAFKRNVLKHPVDGNCYLFSPDGKRRYTTVGLYMSFKKAFRKAGLPSHYSPHSCRHTFATIFLQDTNGDIRACQLQLGHASLTMSSLYCAVLPQRRQELADKLSI